MSSQIFVFANGDRVQFDDVQPTYEPIIGHRSDGGRLIAPLRPVFQALGYTVDWDDEITSGVQTVVVTKGQTIARFQIGDVYFTINGRVQTDYPLPSPPVIERIVINGEVIYRTVMSLIAPLQALGYIVTWSHHSNGRQLNIRTRPGQTPPPIGDGACRGLLNVHDHDHEDFIVNPEGNFICPRCGDVFLSPENQDRDVIRDPSLYLRVRAALYAVPFYEAAGDIITSGYLLQFIEDQRVGEHDNNPLHKYQFSNNGHYARMYEERYKDLPDENESRVRLGFNVNRTNNQSRASFRDFLILPLLAAGVMLGPKGKLLIATVRFFTVDDDPMKLVLSVLGFTKDHLPPEFRPPQTPREIRLRKRLSRLGLVLEAIEVLALLAEGDDDTMVGEWRIGFYIDDIRSPHPHYRREWPLFTASFNSSMEMTAFRLFDESLHVWHR